MHISNNNYHQNFTSVYRIKNANIDDYRKVYLSSILLNSKDQKPVSMFCGNNPFESLYRTQLQALNKKNSKLYNSIVKHFEKIYINLPKNDTFDIWMFDGIDNDAIKKFVKKYKNSDIKNWTISGAYRGERSVRDIEADVMKANSKNNLFTSEFRNKFKDDITVFESVRDWANSVSKIQNR